MPIDLDRLPGGAADLLRASTASCMIEQALALKRLQQTAGILFSGPSPSPAAVLDIARRKGDTSIVYVIAVCAPLLRSACRHGLSVSMTELDAIGCLFDGIIKDGIACAASDGTATETQAAASRRLARLSRDKVRLEWKIGSRCGQERSLPEKVEAPDGVSPINYINYTFFG